MNEKVTESIQTDGLLDKVVFIESEATMLL